MDPAGIARFYEIVSGLRRDLDLSILLVTHDLRAAVVIADRMVVLKDRTLVADGRPAEVLRLELVRETFGFAASSSDAGVPCEMRPGRSGAEEDAP
jgi:iron complex transport system ATP-binding protein